MQRAHSLQLLLSSLGKLPCLNGYSMFLVSIPDWREHHVTKTCCISQGQDVAEVGEGEGLYLNDQPVFGGRQLLMAQGGMARNFLSPQAWLLFSVTTPRQTL